MRHIDETGTGVFLHSVVGSADGQNGIMDMTRKPRKSVMGICGIWKVHVAPPSNRFSLHVAQEILLKLCPFTIQSALLNISWESPPTLQSDLNFVRNGSWLNV